MEHLLSVLQQKLSDHPDSVSLQEAISHLTQVDNGKDAYRSSNWEIIQNDFGKLSAGGLWEVTPENEEMLEDVRKTLMADRSRASSISNKQSSPAGSNKREYEPRRDISVVMPPPLSTPLLPVSLMNPTVLPIELVEVLNHTYFLHLLVLKPESVLPPGKSLLSVMSRPHIEPHHEGELPSLKERVESLVHKAFWDEAYESLSTPTPAIQLPRLKKLYEDLYAALKPLLPAHHPLLVTLSSPLSPTSSPLRTAVTHLREVLVCLRERCAPARDSDIDALIRAIDDLSSVAPATDIARLVVDTVRSILKVAETMKDDLSQFVLGTMGEQQLRAVITTQAKERERELTLQLWKPARVEQLWREWLQGTEVPDGVPTDHSARHRWVHCLMQAIGSTIPVSCPLPTVTISDDSPPEIELAPPHGNVLPPPFFFICPALLYVQNYLQALVIAASLRSLVRLPSTPTLTASAQSNGLDAAGGSFMERTWALLKAEVDEESGSGETKIINLSDEVLRVRRQLLRAGETLDAEEEAKLRAAVDRTLQPHDPVFLLLQKRLLQAVAVRLALPFETESPAAYGPHLPEKLQAGRERPGKRPRLMMELEHEEGTQLLNDKVKEPMLAVKGFDDEVLVKAVGESLVRLRSCVNWVELVWGDLTGGGDLKESGNK
ncbi:uncharacterized protein LAESUDRAFT_727819 [Laetiporus sulphureus 93-53]|uniref:Uncharacterized protein n=1 Tax=Laetiporus sulphureus 93-53 TaxID=1314785 RepID=A0A165DDK7_9APHY|nr:uncharacterized protein LAESUDRAFT_727819 [Laetiporus sulphureus 93-53]KZT04639.1 hypothetical protein LAESUDRAFT_727819 [Laetiporus sulphureus 93-53]